MNPFIPGQTPQAAPAAVPQRAPGSLSVDLPWQSLAAQGNALSGLGGDPASAAAQLGPLYANSYQAALGLNSSLFSGLQTGYDQLRSGVDQKYADITKGYGDLYGDVLGRIAGTNQTNLTDINTAYDARAGGASQDAINRGLGNSTVQSAMQRGIELDRQRALTASQNSFAQLGAGYASQIGQAGLGAGERGIQTGAGLGQAQLGMLERVQAPYPDAGMYTQLASMYGTQAERQRNQGQQDQALAMARGNTGLQGRGGGVVSGGGASAGGGFFGPRMSDPGMLQGGTPSYFGGFGGFGGSPYVRPPGFQSGNYDAGYGFGDSSGGVNGSPEYAWEGSGEGMGGGYSGGYEYSPQPGAYGGLGDYQNFGYADSYA